MQLDTLEKMLDVLFNEVVKDVINAPKNPTHTHDAPSLIGWEEAESHHQLTTILEMIEDDKTEYLNLLDSYIKDYQEHYRGGGDCGE